jgi:hypothetical protein
VTASSTETSGDQSPERDRWALRIKWAALLATVGVALVGVLLLLDFWRPQPVAAPFTRVGGVTHVETAVDASRFWLTSPPLVVETQANLAPQIMLGAARCAMVHNAPLLFTGTTLAQKRLVQETIGEWNNPPRTLIQNQSEVTVCLKERTADKDDIDGLSTLAVPHPLVQLPMIPTQSNLVSFVIFAAPLSPKFLPDVAVGLALGAHMAKANDYVSLVVIPRYLEADPELTSRLESQRELVRGGVVLGQTMTVPDDTRALLRQLLTSTDRHNLLTQIQSDLGSFGPIAAALLALIGLGTAGIAGKKLRDEIKEPTRKQPRSPKPSRAPKRTRQPQPVRRFIMPQFFSGGRSDGQKTTPARSYWRSALGDKPEVTVWLRSGTKVAGTVSNWYPSEVEQDKNHANILTGELLRLDSKSSEVL